MEYKIIEELDIKKLEKEVNNALKEGWKPQGGVAVVAAATSTSLGFSIKANAAIYQALIKDSLREEKVIPKVNR